MTNPSYSSPAADRYQAPPPLFRHLIYQAAEPYDEDRPEFDCYLPAHTGAYWMLDCWVCDKHGNLHPGYNVAPVPVHANSIGSPVAAASAGLLYEED